MAYKFNYRGVEVVTDSADDVVAILAHLGLIPQQRAVKPKTTTLRPRVPVSYAEPDAAPVG